ncbi:uncharacterized protein LOC121246573 isoform X1 [Juglans microcarpa x Juglans regia]|uniref:uncharacterized protein LOC121246573 isoform X1 n=1 Tax=Juglans microcarpa x Juglans regia TaxID=2249226 RepID=UPI001B7F4214|nr:uncharacterized protein LOC121246573 isoform X1 [Juglans microcarpa x Juglans regia]XP_041000682.1 uncharacterized protein LOC121246573 isoform X1 [Juglans microcarpa x Juglans regia]
MNRRRKSKKYNFPDKSQTPWTTNCSAPARNLRKSDLGGVIFGCKNNTIEECYSEQLFGLPRPHFSYVKNVSIGLPLFLFNYSDRKLHGIFEAASQGQLDIRPYGWTQDGSDTPFPAQVKIRILMPCHPLLEDQFRTVISSNYYEPRLFWFELDRDQTKDLISLFSASPLTVSTSIPGNTHKRNSVFKASSVQEIGCPETPASEWDAHPDQISAEWQRYDAPGLFGIGTLIGENVTEKDEEPGEHEQTYASVARCAELSFPQKKWSALFKSSDTSTVGNEALDFMETALELNLPCIAPCLDGRSNLSEAPADGSVRHDEQLIGLKPSSQVVYCPVATGANSSDENLPAADQRWEGEDFETATSDSYLFEPNMRLSSSCDAPCLDIDVEFSKVCTDECAAEIGCKENIHFRPTGECSSFSAMTKEMSSKHKRGEEKGKCGMASDDICFPEAPIVLESKSSKLESAVAEVLQQEVRELKLSHLKQVQKIISLEQALIESRRGLRSLNDQYKILDCGLFPKTGLVTEKECESSDEPCSDLDVKVLIVGGYDGSLWSSALGCYSPSRDLMESLSPMNFIRSHASAAELNGDLYLFGGVYNNWWYDTVESYNPISNQWVSRPSLDQKKGRLAGISLNQKIFAIGGGNGVQCFSEVEMFDPYVGRWIPVQPMRCKRFDASAVEINGTIYVTGGQNEKVYLKSAERFDPREHLWTRLGKMSTKRSGHLLSVLNEKLYAVGGHDGNRMVSSVEVFDPRAGSWMTVESLTCSRGCFGAVVIADSLYVIGGLNENEEILDTVECYKEGHGWTLTNLRGVGKRCTFSAVVM